MNKKQESVQQKKETEKQRKTENRIGVERRVFSYSFYVPERRSGKDRRKQLDITIRIE